MNKGFTLVELLAVIIILGVLTLVTVVSVNPILKDAKKGLSETQINNIKESANLYYVKHGIGVDDYELDNPKYCINVSELIELGYIDSDEVTNPKTGEEILGSVKVTYKSNNYIYEYQDDTCTNYDKGIICERVKSTEAGNVPEGKFVAGDAYNCKVDPDKEPYKFYILTTPDENSDMVNLIMDRNINSDGTPVMKTIYKENAENGVYNAVEWISKEDYIKAGGFESDWYVEVNYSDLLGGNNTKGPLTSMKFLYNATKKWTNIQALNYVYNDRDYQNITEDNKGYMSFISKNGILTITPFLGNKTIIGTKDEPLRARMPIYTENPNNLSQNEIANFDNTNLYLQGYLNDSKCYDGMGSNVGNQGYWTISSNVSSYLSFAMWYDCYVDNAYVNESSVGIRPVISVYKFQME